METISALTWTRRAACGIAAVLWWFGPDAAGSQNRSFTLDGLTSSLEDVTAEVDVFYQSMRLNRAVNEWNVEVTISNKTGRALSSPLVLVIETHSGTSGALRPDGIDTTGKAFYHLGPQLFDGALSPGDRSTPRTLSLGMAAGAPSLSTLVFGKPSSTPALGLTRSLNEVGQPLPQTTVIENGPTGPSTNLTDPVFASVTLGQKAGAHLWKFSAAGYLPAWREHTLSTSEVAVVMSPRLTRRGTNVLALTPVGGGPLTNGDGSIQISFPPGAVTTAASATLTPLTGQTLPALLPLGWSPLQAFWLELETRLAAAASATLRLWGPLLPGDTPALARLNPTNGQWEAIQLAAGTGSGLSGLNLPGSGAYALVVGDSGALAPPLAQIGQALQSSSASLPEPASLSAGGLVTPTSSAASHVPELVTATATVLITNQGSPMPSGVRLRCELTESYKLRDGTRRTTPRYENFIVGYQRPGDSRAETLQAVFPLRPLLPLGAEELDEATVRAEVLLPQAFTGSVLSPHGSEVRIGALRLLANEGVVDTPQAVNVRLLDPSQFTNLLTAGESILAAFDLTLGRLAEGGRLGVQLAGAPSNSLMVLARVITAVGLYGLEPRERLSSEAAGQLRSLEPTGGERLPGLTGSGQYVLVQVGAPHALVSGVARNSQGTPTAGLPVRLDGQPWLSVSGAGGQFCLAAPLGTATLLVTDLATSDSGLATVQVVESGGVFEVAATPAGPRVVRTTPADTTTGVSRVTPIVVEFSEPLNPASLAADGIQVLGTNNQPVPASLTLNLRGTAATLVPAGQLAAGVGLTIVLSSNLADLSGMKLEGTTMFTFTTERELLDRSGAQLTIFEPVDSVVPVYGAPGTAEAESPVILINESSGRTATVLSGPDGSFTNTIAGNEEDFITAVLVNRNGTSTMIPAGRQIFRDGSVGLYSGGGEVSGQGANGPVTVSFPAGVIQTRNRIKVEPMTDSQVAAIASNTPPVDMTFLVGTKVRIEGGPLSGDSDISFPFDPSVLSLPPDANPENAAFVLCAVVPDDDGRPSYQIMDKLRYSKGRLFSNTYPFSGFAAVFGAEVETDRAVAQLIAGYLGRDGVVISGTVYETLAAAGAAGKAPRTLRGAFVALRNEVTTCLPGRFPSGHAYATTGRDGRFALMLPVGAVGYIVQATHPRYAERPSLPVLPVVTEGLLGTEGLVPQSRTPIEKNLYFSKPATEIATVAQIRIAHTPTVPPAPGSATLQIDASHDSAPPTFGSISVAEVKDLETDAMLPTSVVAARAGGAVTHSMGVNRIRVITSIECQTNTPVVAKLTVEVQVGGVPYVNSHTIVFRGAPPAVTGPLTSADPNDTVGPVVTYTEPAPGGSVVPGQRIRICFNEAVSPALLSDPSQFVLNDPSIPPPSLSLSADQSQLDLVFAGLVPGSSYTLTVGSSVIDLNGNALDQEPSMPGNQAFSLAFQAPGVVQTPLPDLQYGGGVVVHGSYAFALERTSPSGVVVYNISDPSVPSKVARMAFPGYPRDLVLIPAYGYVRAPSGSAVTQDLLVVVGGLVGGAMDVVGNIEMKQHIRVYDVTDPEHPAVVAGGILTRRDVVATKVRWSAPYLACLHASADAPMIALIHLQELILGFNATADQIAAFGSPNPGVDANGDGDYVDPGDQLPVPDTRAELFGQRNLYTLGRTTQELLDFAFHGDYCGVTLSGGYELDDQGNTIGPALPPCYRTLAAGGQLLEPPRGVLPFDSGTPPDTRPKRLSALFAQPVAVGTGLETRDLALVSLAPADDGTNKLAVLDISQPELPTRLQLIPFDFLGTNDYVQSILRREDGLLALATSTRLILLEPTKLSLPSPPGTALHPAVVGFVPGAGSANISLGGNAAGVQAVCLGGRNQLVQTAPSMSFVQFVSPALVDPIALIRNDVLIRQALDAMVHVSAIQPARFRAEGGAVSTMQPALPPAHYYVLVKAPGGAGPSLDLGLESLNRTGFPLKNKGPHFAPVRALSSATLALLDQEARPGCDAPIRPLKAYRLSPDPHSPYHNLYLSVPFALTYEKMSADELDALRATAQREVLWSGAHLRACIDPSMATNSVLGPFAAQVNSLTKILEPVATVIAESFPAGYIMGPNPPPVRGHLKVPGTFGLISAHNGEFRHETVDLELPSRRRPIVFERAIGGQDLTDGPFGRGWSFNYGQHLTELRPAVFPSSGLMPQVTRADPKDSTLARAGDVLFDTGMGRVFVFTNAGSIAPPPVAADPLVQLLGWHVGATYFLPEKGVFDLLFRFPDGQFARLTPGGTQYWYNRYGRLERIYDRYTKNQHVLFYNNRDELTRIEDKSVTTPRLVEIGYYRLPADPEFNPRLDERTNKVFITEKVKRLKDNAGREVLFDYDDNGILQARRSVSITAVNNGFGGRPLTEYIRDACTGDMKGLRQGGGGAGIGTPLFVATVSATSLQASSGTGAGGTVFITPPANNLAAATDYSVTTVIGTDGARTMFTFDQLGNTREVRRSGYGAGAAVHATRFNNLGLLEETTFPEGNRIAYTYNPADSVLRSLPNPLSVTKEPGSRGGDTLTATYRHDERYNVLSGTVVDFNGKSLTYTLTTDGKEVRSIDYAGAGSQSFTYNAYGQLVGETSPTGVTRGIGYRADDGFPDFEERGGIRSRFSYDLSIASQLGAPASLIPPRGHTVQLKYDERLLPVEVTRGPSSVRTGYDENGNTTFREETLAPGQTRTERRTYNQISFLEELTVERADVDGAPATITKKFEPDAAWRVGRAYYATGGGGDISIASYNHLGHLTRLACGDYAEDYGRDLHGNVVSLTKGGDVVQTNTYDGHDQAVLVENLPGSRKESFSMSYFGNGEGKSLKVTDPRYGVVYDRQISDLDGLGRPRMEKMGGTSRTIGYTSGSGGSISVTGPVSNETKTVTYDAGGRATKIQSSVASVDLAPNDNDYVEHTRSTEEAGTYETWHTYDPLDHESARSDGEGTSYTFTPRFDGLREEIRDAFGRSTRQEFTVLGEPKSVCRPNGVTFNYQYNQARQLTSVADGTLCGLRYSYDSTHRLKEVTLRDPAHKIAYHYDKRLEPTSMSLPGGGSVSLTRDRLGRIVGQDVQFGGQSYRISDVEHDALGRVRKSRFGSSGQFAKELGYDLLGPLTSVKYATPNGDFPISSTLNPDGTRQQVTYPSGTLVHEDRQPSGRLLKVRDASAIYEAIPPFAGAELPREVVLGNNAIREHRLYDSRKRLLANRYVRGTEGPVIAEVRYQYDAANNVTARQFIHRAGRQDRFGYDEANRLTSAEIGLLPPIEGPVEAPASVPFYARSYTYDTNGLDELQGSTLTGPADVPAPPFATNISGFDAFLFARTVDGLDRGAPDGLGNALKTRLCVREPGAAEPVARTGVRLRYNGLSQLVSIEREDGVLIQYEYQPNGLMLERTLSRGGTNYSRTVFIYDQGVLIEEYEVASGSPVLRARYYYADQDAPAAADLADAKGVLRRYYYLRDSQLSVIAVADDSGRVVERVWYDPWGQPVIEAADTSPPTVARIVRSGDSLLVQFTETITPTLRTPAPGASFIAKLPSVTGAITLSTGSDILAADVDYMEDLPGYPFGTVLRVTPREALPANISLTVHAERLADEWGNLNSLITVPLTVPSGELVIYTGSPEGSTAAQRVAHSTLGSPFLFHGQWFDYDAGLLYLRARFYDPSTGLFLQRDPKEYKDSVNAYAAFAHCPSTKRDPEGLFADPIPIQPSEAQTEDSSCALITPDNNTGYPLATLAPPNMSVPDYGCTILQYDDSSQGSFSEYTGYVVIYDCDMRFRGLVELASTFPDNLVDRFTIAAGAHLHDNTDRHNGNTEPGLNLRNPWLSYKESRKEIPSIVRNKTTQHINQHKGNLDSAENKGKGSSGCLTIPHGDNWKRFVNLTGANKQGLSKGKTWINRNNACNMPFTEDEWKRSFDINYPQPLMRSPLETPQLPMEPLERPGSSRCIDRFRFCGFHPPPM